ncbi:MAG: glucosyltransferase domain-containing protein [Lachnospiraceae bacterium]|nr:glucosyltransferase domain-containing protein [Lachnospiraceae bacterium]
MKKFVKDNKKSIIAAYIFTLLCFGFMLVHYTLSIDEETHVLGQAAETFWLSQSRWGVTLFNLIFTRSGEFVPFLWDFLAVSLWFASGVVLLFGLKRECGKLPQFASFLFLAYFSSLPYVMSEIMAFSMFSLQVSVGIFCAALGFVLTRDYFEHGNRKLWIPIVLLLTYATAIYQAPVCIYITAIAAYCLMGVLKGEYKIWKKIYTAGILCLVSIALYGVINMITTSFIPGNDYLAGNYIGWFSGKGIVHTLLYSILNVARVSLGITYRGNSIYSGGILFVVTVCFVIWAVFTFVKTHEKGGKSRILFLTVALALSPFLMYIAMGDYATQGRHMLSLTLAGAVELYLVYESFQGKKVRMICAVLASYLLFVNCRDMNMLYYYDAIRYDKDVATAHEVMHDIEKLGYDYHTKPIVFIGKYDMDNIPIAGSQTLGMGASFWQWDDGNMSRIQDFLEVEGYETIESDGVQRQEALTYKDSMSKWPQEGSIIETEDIIIVKFSEPTEIWYETNNVR